MTTAQPPTTPGMTPGQYSFHPTSPCYRFFHNAVELGEQVPIGLGTRSGGTFLGSVIVNTGGTFSLTLYNGSGTTASVVAAITNPLTGAVFPFDCFVEQGLTCTMTGMPGDVTITFMDQQS